MFSRFTIFQTTYRLAKCAGATSANSESMKTELHHVELGDQPEEMMMAVYVLLRNVQSK